MTSFVLKAQPREKLGKSEAKRIKNSGLIPAVIYSKDGKNINISVDAREFEKEYFKGFILTSPAKLDLNGKEFEVIAHKVELDPVSDRPVHIDFASHQKGQTIKAQPKLVFVNSEKSPGLKKGGFLHVVARKVTVICQDPNAIPEKIEVDVGSMQVGGKIRGSNLTLPNGVTLEKKTNFLIASILGRGLKADAADAAATPGAEGAAAPAAATPAAAKADDKKAPEKKAPEKK